MPQVLHDAPAAVLVIDLDRQQVVYANAAAIALTGEHVGLPAGPRRGRPHRARTVTGRRRTARRPAGRLTRADPADRSRITSARSAYG